MATVIGRVVGDVPPSLKVVWAIKNKDADVRPLEYLMTEFTRNGRKYGLVLRVVNLQNVSRYVSAESVHVSETTGLSFVPSWEEERGQYTLIEMEPVDAYVIENGEVKPIGPTVVPPVGNPVKKINNEALEALIGRVEHPVYIGSVAGNESIPAYFEANNLIRHLIIVGGTGSGKSWLRGVLMEKLHELGVIQVNFDFLDEYSKAVEELGGKNLTIGKDYRPRLDMFTPGEFEVLIKNYIPTDFQKAIARQGFFRYARESRSRLEPLPPEKIIDYINAAASEYNARRETRENTIYRTLAFLQDFDIFGRGMNWARELKKYKLINIRFTFASEEIMRAGFAAALKEILHYRQIKAIPPLIVSFDEAHMLIPERTVTVATTVVKRVLRYGRHLGLGLILITQRPSSIDSEAVAMPAMRIIFSLDPAEMKYIRPLLSDLGKYAEMLIPRLEQGTAVITGTMDLIRHSLYVRITNKRKTTHGGETPKLLE